MVATPDGARLARAEAEGNDPAALAERCAAALRAEGAEDILQAGAPAGERPEPGAAVSAPLQDLRVVVTRAASQGGGLAAALAAAGARVEILPLLEIVAPADPRALERAASELAALPLARLHFGQRRALVPAARRWRAPAAPTGRSGGPRHRPRAPRGRNHPRDRGADGAAEGLVEALRPHVGRRQRVLLPQAADARDALAAGLTAAGAEVVRGDRLREAPAGGRAGDRRAALHRRSLGLGDLRERQRGAQLRVPLP